MNLMVSSDVTNPTTWSMLSFQRQWTEGRSIDDTIQVKQLWLLIQLQAQLSNTEREHEEYITTDRYWRRNILVKPSEIFAF